MVPGPPPLDHATAPNGRTLQDRLGWPARAAILAGVFFVEKNILTRFVDLQRAEAAQGIGNLLRIAQHLGLRFVVALVAALAVFAYARGKRPAAATSPPPHTVHVRPLWIAAHLALLACLAWLSYWLFPAAPLPIPFAAIAGVWLVCGAAAILCAFAAMAPLPRWLQAARSLGSIWLYAAAAALAAVMTIHLSEEYWRTAAAVTFQLVGLILRPILPGLIVDPAHLVLGTQRFGVQILAYCSGLEGMSLILAFTIAWLGYFRRDFRFPRALVVIPLALALMFALNAVRIAVLLLIGNAGYPDVAIYGFHSQAGWIAFNTVAIGIAVWTRRSRWLNRRGALPARATTDNPAAAFLMPFLAILAAGMLSHALSGRFEWLYPLRLLAALAALLVYRRPLAALDWQWSWRGPLVGIGAFVVWFAAAHYLAPPAGMPPALAAASPALRWGWLGCRVAASVVTVPLAEELAFRGFLMRRLQSRDFDALGYARVGWAAIAGAAVLFGVEHGAMWLPGILVGFAYGWIVKRQGRLGEAVAAHMATNLLLAAVALGLGNWSAF